MPTCPGAEVGHIVATLKAAGRQHALVAESGPDGTAQTVRGIFSLSQIARQLGVTIAYDGGRTHVCRDRGRARSLEAALGGRTGFDAWPALSVTRTHVSRLGSVYVD